MPQAHRLHNITPQGRVDVGNPSSSEMAEPGPPGPASASGIGNEAIIEADGAGAGAGPGARAGALACSSVRPCSCANARHRSGSCPQATAPWPCKASGHAPAQMQDTGQAAALRQQHRGHAIPSAIFLNVPAETTTEHVVACLTNPGRGLWLADGRCHSMMHRLANGVVERAHAQAEAFRPAAHLGLASKAPVACMRVDASQQATSTSYLGQLNGGKAWRCRQQAPQCDESPSHCG